MGNTVTILHVVMHLTRIDLYYVYRLLQFYQANSLQRSVRTNVALIALIVEEGVLPLAQQNGFEVPRLNELLDHMSL